MKKLLLALALFFIPALAQAQCNGVFPNNTACGNITGGSNTPRPVPLSSFPVSTPGGTNGQVQYNNNGAFGGYTAAQLTALINQATGSLSGAVPQLPLPVNVGGNGTATPGLVAGANVTITGSWPNQTIASSGGGGGGSSAACVQDFIGGTDFTAGTTTTLTTTCTPSNSQSIAVFFDGVKQSANTWSLTSSTFTFSAAIPLFTQVVEVQAAIPGTTPVIDSSLASTGKSLWYNSVTGSYSYAFTSPSGPVFDLRDCMDKQYGVGGWTISVTDTQPAIQACVATLVAQAGRGTIYVPPGNWQLAHGLVLSGSCLRGEGSQASVFTVNMTSGTAFLWTGKQGAVGGYTGGCMRGIGARLCCNLGITTTIAIALVGDATFQPDQMEFDDQYITADCNAGTGGGSWWNNGFIINGSSRTVPQGTRVGTVNNMQLFCNAAFGWLVENSVGWTINNIGTFVGNPSTGTGTDCYITGAGAPLQNTIILTITQLNCGGALHLNNASKIWLYGQASTAIFTAATTSNIMGQVVIGSVSGTVGANSALTVVP